MKCYVYCLGGEPIIICIPLTNSRKKLQRHCWKGNDGKHSEARWYWTKNTNTVDMLETRQQLGNIVR